MKWLVIAALILSGCGKKKQEPAPEPAGSAAPVATGSATGSAAPTPPPAPAAVDVPTEQDFEAQAKTDVTDKNVDTKLKDLESQLAQ